MKVIAAWLRNLAERIDPSPRSVYYDAAHSLVVSWNSRLPPAHWESKRKQVLVGLMKMYPEARKRDLSFAIEQAIQEL